MSWNTAALLTRHDGSLDSAGLLTALGFRDPTPSRVVSLEEATSRSLAGKAVGAKDGWAAVWDPDGFFAVADPEPADEGFWPAVIDRAFRRLSRGGRALGLLWGGVSGIHGFALYTGGERTRWWVQCEGEVRGEGGNPDKVEREVFAQTEDNEDRLFLLMQEWALPVEALKDVPFQVFTVAAPP